MSIQDLIEVASGTVTGRDHTFGGNLVLGKPNQDAIATAWTENAFVAVLCDGCSSGEHSEVGAQLICRLLLSEIVHQMNTTWDAPPSQSPGVWSFGDCAVWIDGQMNHVKFPGNAPPYLGYLMLPRHEIKVDAEELVFKPIRSTGIFRELLRIVPSDVVASLERLTSLFECTAEGYVFLPRQVVETYFLCTATVVIIDETYLDMLPIVVGTDGLADVPDPSIFLEDRMFANPANATRTLRKMNQPTMRIGGDPPRLIKTDGVLPDDTTLVAIRRKVQPCA
jgi:hypothetical protein